MVFKDNEIFQNFHPKVDYFIYCFRFIENIQRRLCKENLPMNDSISFTFHIRMHA